MISMPGVPEEVGGRPTCPYCEIPSGFTQAKAEGLACECWECGHYWIEEFKDE